MDSTQKNKILNQFVARRLIQFRIHHGISQERLAKHLGLSAEQIQSVENGSRPLEAIRLYEACQVFGTSLAAFFKCYRGFEEQYLGSSRSSVVADGEELGGEELGGDGGFCEQDSLCEQGGV